MGGGGGDVSLDTLLSIIDFNEADNTAGRCTLAYLHQYLMTKVTEVHGKLHLACMQYKFGTCHYNPPSALHLDVPVIPNVQNGCT